MASDAGAALGFSRALLRILVALNLATGAIAVLAFASTFLFEDTVAGYFDRRAFDVAIVMPALRIWLVLAAPYVAAVHVMLSRLIAIVETVRLGNPFMPDNAARLKTIALALLVTQLLHLVFGVMVRVVEGGGVRMGWTISIGGWIAVVLLFVLARVFEEGTRLRGDLEAMI